MPSFSVQSWVDYSLCLAHSFFLCSLRNQQLLMLVCRGFVLWHSAMRLAVLWMAVSPHPEASEKYSAYHYRYPGLLRISYCLDLYSICTFPDDFITVSFVYLLMGNYRTCRNSVFVVSFNIIYSKNSPSSIGGR